jgi:hypothetical protein
MNPVVFLDYYHPYAGLCNQLYLITNHIHYAFVKGLKIYIHKINIDIFKKERIPAEEFFDLLATAENLKQLTGKDILLFEKPTKNFIIPKLCIYPVSSIEMLNCLEFHKRFTQLVPKKKYNGIHFRLELDAIIHYLFEKQCYENFMDRCNNSTLDPKFPEKFINFPQVQIYIDYLLKQYTTFIIKYGNKNPWFISTLVGKKDIHKVLEPTLKKLTDFIENCGGTWFTSPQHFEQRELNALVDLLTLRESVSMIGFEGSSYSEGYCFKVNSIRNKDKEYSFINGIVPKLSDGLYESLSNDTILCK